MKYILTCALLLAFPTLALAEISNLNQSSSMTSDGIGDATTPQTVLDGIPLMKGLELVTDKDFIDVLPDSNNLEPIETVGILDVDDIYNYYKRTLPPLGWTPTSGRDYIRGNVTLHIDAHADGKTSTVTFTENPVSPP